MYRSNFFSGLQANLCQGRNDLKFFARFRSDAGNRLAASTVLFFFRDVVDHLHPGKIGRKGFAASLDSGMSTNRNSLLFFLRLPSGGDHFRLVEQPQLSAVLFGKPFGTAANLPGGVKLTGTFIGDSVKEACFSNTDQNSDDYQRLLLPLEVIVPFIDAPEKSLLLPRITTSPIILRSRN